MEKWREREKEGGGEFDDDKSRVELSEQNCIWLVESPILFHTFA